MKITDLEIGDRIKYFSPHLQAFREGEVINILSGGISLKINDLQNDFIPKNYLNNIVFKMQPKKIEYTEIPITKTHDFSFEIKVNQI